jgi:hypothetical protein
MENFGGKRRLKLRQKKQRLKLGGGRRRAKKTTPEIGDQKNLKLRCEFRYITPQKISPLIKKTDKHTIEIIHTTTAARLKPFFTQAWMWIHGKNIFLLPNALQNQFCDCFGGGDLFFNIFPNKTYGKLVSVLAHRSRKILGTFSCVHNRTPREKNLGSKRRPISGSVFGFITEKNKASKKKYNTADPTISLFSFVGRALLSWNYSKYFFTCLAPPCPRNPALKYLFPKHPIPSSACKKQLLSSYTRFVRQCTRVYICGKKFHFNKKKIYFTFRKQ